MVYTNGELIAESFLGTLYISSPCVFCLVYYVKCKQYIMCTFPLFLKKRKGKKDGRKEKRKKESGLCLVFCVRVGNDDDAFALSLIWWFYGLAWFWLADYRLPTLDLMIGRGRKKKDNEYTCTKHKAHSQQYKVQST